MKQAKIRNYFTFFLLVYLPLSCQDHITSSIPEYPVFLDLNLATTYPTFRNSTNQTLVFKTRDKLPDISRIGFGGILVCTDYVGDYYAYDLCCPYELKANTRVHPDGVGQAICDSCKSIFNIFTAPGTPVSGKAKEFLKRYKANLNGDILRISR
jgi:hypothetical protein